MRLLRPKSRSFQCDRREGHTRYRKRCKEEEFHYHRLVVSRSLRISDNSTEREHNNGDYEIGRHDEHEEEKKAVIFDTYTIIDPGTMMVKSFNTTITECAVT